MAFFGIIKMSQYRIAQVTEYVNGVPKQYNVYRDWFVYTFPAVATLAALAAARSIVNIQADANFICEKINVFADLAGAAQTVQTQVVPLITVQINDSASGKNLFSDALPIAAIAGPNLAGYELPLARCFTSGGTVQAAFYNYSAATPYNNVYLMMHGYKEWRIN